MDVVEVVCRGAIVRPSPGELQYHGTHMVRNIAVIPLRMYWCGTSVHHMERAVLCIDEVTMFLTVDLQCLASVLHLPGKDDFALSAIGPFVS